MDFWPDFCGTRKKRSSLLFHYKGEKDSHWKQHSHRLTYLKDCINFEPLAMHKARHTPCSSRKPNINIMLHQPSLYMNTAVVFFFETHAISIFPFSYNSLNVLLLASAPKFLVSVNRNCKNQLYKVTTLRHASAKNLKGDWSGICNKILLAHWSRGLALHILQSAWSF